MKKENSTHSINQEILNNFCETHKILSQITGRWKISLVLALENKTLHYSDFKQILPTITDRILTKQLNELKNDAILINDKSKTESIYFLTEKGKKILQLLHYIKHLNLH